MSRNLFHKQQLVVEAGLVGLSTKDHFKLLAVLTQTSKTYQGLVG